MGRDHSGNAVRTSDKITLKVTSFEVLTEMNLKEAVFRM
jgi:hypothetical protein